MERAPTTVGSTGTAIKAVVPEIVATLSGIVIGSPLFTEARLASVFVILGTVSAIVGLSLAAPVGEKPGSAGSQTKAAGKQGVGPQAVGSPRVNEKANGDSVAIRGRVLDPNGNPVSGAEIVLAPPPLRPADSPSPRHLGISRADGRFEVRLAREALVLSGPYGIDHPVIAAFAAGLGPEWVSLDPQSAGNTLSLRLRRDDVPIEGRLTNLEGKPIPGLIIRVLWLNAAPTKLIDKIREHAGTDDPGLWTEKVEPLFLGENGPIAPVRTGVDGRFRLTGVGRDRVVYLRIEGDSVERSAAMVYTSSDPAYTPPVVAADEVLEGKVFGPGFDLTVAPGRVIEGTIRDSQSGRPVSGVSVQSELSSAVVNPGPIVTATSDTQGRFRLSGMPKKPVQILEFTSEAQPYPQIDKLIRDTPGLGPIHVEIRFMRGVWVEGRVRNQANGRPVKAIVQYYPLRDNPHLAEFHDASFLNESVTDDAEFATDADGRFRVVAAPGTGVLGVRTIERTFLRSQPLSSKDAANVSHPLGFADVMGTFEACVRINAPNLERFTIPDIAVVPGRTQHVRVAAADGRPVAGIRLSGNPLTILSDEVSTGSEFTFVHPELGKDEEFVVLDQDQTAGALLTVKGDEPDPIRLTLQPVGTVAGRLVDEEGRPRPSVRFVVMLSLATFGFDRSSVQSRTGADGRFQIKALVPGVSYSAMAVKSGMANDLDPFVGSIGKPQWTVKPGEIQNWGDVQVEKMSP